MTTVLVLGASGFIGTRVMQLAAAAGHEVVAAAFVRPIEPVPGVQARNCDVRDGSSLVRAMTGVDVVVNCVSGDARTLTAGVVRMCEAAAACRSVRRIVHISSLAVYGSSDRWVDEQSAARPTGWYARAKHAAERAVAAWARGSSDAVLLRPGIVYGPLGEAWTLRIARLLHQGRLGDLGAAGDGRCNLVYVDDVARAAVAAVGLGPIDGCLAVNLAGSDGWTWNRYLRRMAAVAEAPRLAHVGRARLLSEAWLIAGPLRAAEALARRTGAFSGRVPDAIPPSLVRLFRQELIVDTALAEVRLRVAWTPASSGLRLAAASRTEPSATRFA